MKPNYKQELNAMLIRKHKLIRERTKLDTQLKDATDSSKALSTLSGNPYDLCKLASAEMHEKDRINELLDRWVNVGGFTDRYKFGRLSWDLDGFMEENHPVSDEDLETYAGILIDLVEKSLISDEKVPAWRFHLRVYFNDDVEAFVNAMAPEVGLTPKPEWAE